MALNINPAAAAATVDTIFLIILIFLFVVIIITVVTIFLLAKQFKHTFIRKIITGGPPIILIDKAKEFKEKDTGVIYWKLLKAGHTIVRPPGDALHTTKNGNYAVEAEYLGDINYNYAKAEILSQTEHDINTITTKAKITAGNNLKSGLINRFIDLYKKNLFKLAIFKPSPIYVYVTPADKTIKQNQYDITTNQRLLVAGQVKNAYERRSKGIGQYIPMIAGISALVILIAVVFIFGGDLIKPMVELNAKNAQVTEKIAGIAGQLENTARLLSQVVQERQIIQNGQNTGGTVALLNGTAPG